MQTRNISGSAVGDTVERWGGLASDVGANAQGALIDVGLWLYHGFFLPGDQLLSTLTANAPRVAQFLGLDAFGHGGVLCGIISGVTWLGAIAFIVYTCKLIRHVDRTLTAYVEVLYDGLLRTVRIVARRLVTAFRYHQLKRQARLARTEVSEGELSALEVAVLRFHARLAPGHLLTASGTAAALRMRQSHVEQALARLKMLSLVDRTFGAGDGEDGYRLTRPGAVFLAACDRAQPAKSQDGPKDIAGWHGGQLSR